MAGIPKAWHAASRPCSPEVDARLGNPITSPAAYMLGASVWKCSFTLSCPRLSAFNPTASRFSDAVAPVRPTLYSVASVTICLPLTNWTLTCWPRSSSNVLAKVTSSSRRSVILFWRMWYIRVSTISASTKCSSLG